MIGIVIALDLLARVLYLLAPLLLAAAISGVVMRRNWLSALYVPLDGGIMYRGQPLFGHSKTWRGVAVAVLGCIAGAAIQRYVLAPFAGGIAVVDYSRLNVLTFGAAMGAAAMLGELPNSFVKRRLGIRPGATTHGLWAVVFYVWDQLDLLTVVWPALACWVHPRPALVVTSFVLALILHPLTSLVGFAIGARKTAR